MRYLLVLGILFSFSVTYAQKNQNDSIDTSSISFDPTIKTKEEKEAPFPCIIDAMPTFPGGDEALSKFVSDSLRYPQNGGCVEGRVIVRFTIAKDGSVINPEVLRGLAPNFDKEVLRIIKIMPKWIPVDRDCIYTMPVIFRLKK